MTDKPSVYDESFAVDAFADDEIVRRATAAYMETTVLAMQDPDLELDPGAVHEAALLAAVRATVAGTLDRQFAAYAKVVRRAGVDLDNDSRAAVDIDLAAVAEHAAAVVRNAVEASQRGTSDQLDYPIADLVNALTVIAAFRAAFGMEETPIADDLVTKIAASPDPAAAHDVLTTNEASRG